MSLRAIRHAAVLALIAAAAVITQALAGPPELEAIVAERAAAHGVQPGYLISLVECESAWEPYAIGARGELGLVQLAWFGLLPHFFEVGYTDPFDPTESVDYLARAVSGEWHSAGIGLWHWSCA